MFRWALRIVALLAFIAAECSGPQRPNRWTVERQVPVEDIANTTSTMCHDVADLALGRFAEDPDPDPDLGQTLDELSRIAPLVGTSDALPPLIEAHAAVDAGHSPALPLGEAAPAMDEASFAECGIPVFTALYLSTSFASCHGRVALPVAGLAPETTGCEPAASALYLPCFDPAAGYAPTHCQTGESVRLAARG